MGSFTSSPLVEEAADHCAHCLDATRIFVHDAWLATNDVCSNSICSPLWPKRWSDAAAARDPNYMAVHARHDEGESFQYASAHSHPPPPPAYGDRALFAIDDADETIASSLPSTHAVPHYSYRAPEAIALGVSASPPTAVTSFQTSHPSPLPPSGPTTHDEEDGVLINPNDVSPPTTASNTRDTATSSTDTQSSVAHLDPLGAGRKAQLKQKPSKPRK